jgi:predicted transcriptional regulator
MQLEEFRLAKNYSFSELSKQLGVKRSTVYSICKGGTVSLETAYKILKKTGGAVSYGDLLKEAADV